MLPCKMLMCVCVCVFTCVCFFCNLTGELLVTGFQFPLSSQNALAGKELATTVDSMNRKWLVEQ